MASFQAQTKPHSGLSLWACILLPHPSGILLFIATVQVSHPRLPLSGWLLTNVQVNIITMLHDTRHTCIYITLVLPFIASFYTSSIFLGRLAALHSLCLLHLLPYHRTNVRQPTIAILWDNSSVSALYSLSVRLWGTLFSATLVLLPLTEHKRNYPGV